MVLGLTMLACTNTDSSSKTISILEDVTETDFKLQPTSEAIVNLLNLEDDIWQGIAFRYGSISSLIHNRRYESELKESNALLGNEIQREAEVEVFKTELDSLLNSTPPEKEYKYSSIWIPLVKEITHLQNKRGGTIYLFSDLQENNQEWFSVHRPNDVKKLKQSPLAVKDLFISHAASVKTNSSNVTVVVVYQPKSIEEDRNYLLMQELYQAVFKELDIDISFTSHI